MRVLWRPLYHFALSKCKDPDTAKDLTSQAILALVENVGSGLEIRDHEAWCVTVLKNKFKDHVKKKRESQFRDTMPEDENTDWVSPAVKAGTSKVEKVGPWGASFIQTDHSRILFSQCLEQLNPNHKDVMLMNLIKGLTTAAISEVLDKPQNTILTWLTSAKTQFHDCIQGQS